MLIKQNAFNCDIPSEIEELIPDDNGSYYDPRADYSNHENRPVTNKQPKNKFKLLASIKQHPFKWGLGVLGTAGGLLGLAYYLSHNNEKKRLTKVGGEFDLPLRIFDVADLEDAFQHPGRDAVKRYPNDPAGIFIRGVPSSPKYLVKKYNKGVVTYKVNPDAATLADFASTERMWKDLTKEQVRAKKFSRVWDGLENVTYDATKYTNGIPKDSFEAAQLKRLIRERSVRNSNASKQHRVTNTNTNTKPNNKPNNKTNNKRAHKNNNRAATNAVERMSGKNKLLIGGITALGLLGAGLLGSHIYDKHLEKQDNG